MGNIFVVAEQFRPHGRIIDIREFGKGNINNTFLVTLDAKSEKHFILQRINTHVFRRPELVMRNMRIATEHIHQRLKTALLGSRRWEVPAILMTQDSRAHWIDSDGSFWRAVSFIEDSQSFEAIKDIAHAGEIGYALGMFHTLLSDLPPEKLADTLEGFHITPRYLSHYDEVLAKYSATNSPDVNYCLQIVNRQRAGAHILEDAKKEGRLQLRIIHGDPKVNNIMMDAAAKQTVGIVDLDTVKPGLVHYDIGDCLRSGCNIIAEETEQWEKVRFDTEICHAIMQGYIPIAGKFLTENDFYYLYDSIRLIAFELGLRFLTDYLKGNVYFKVKHREHNLARALVQFRLTESIESQEKAIRSIIKDIR